MTNSQQCPLQLASHLLRLDTELRGSPESVLTALDDFFHVPRHEPHIENSRVRVQDAARQYETQGNLPQWVSQAVHFISDNPHLVTHHHSTE